MSEDSIWQKDSPKADPGERLLTLLKQLAEGISDPKILEQVADAEKEFTTAKKIVSQPPPAYALQDMPQDVLDGRLGEICERNLCRYPRAFAWTATVAVASALVPRQSASQKFNINAALVGPVGAGKTETIRAAQTLLQIESPELLDAMVGSGEGLYHPSFQTIAFLMEETGECGELSNAAAAWRLNSIRQYVHFSQCLESNCLGSNMAGSSFGFV